MFSLLNGVPLCVQKMKSLSRDQKVFLRNALQSFYIVQIAVNQKAERSLFASAPVSRVRTSQPEIQLPQLQ
jgi:hypothetical protein